MEILKNAEVNTHIKMWSLETDSGEFGWHAY
jgi:hypothetical protein